MNEWALIQTEQSFLRKHFLSADHISFQVLLMATIIPKNKYFIFNMPTYTIRSEEGGKNKTHQLNREKSILWF